jgi:hypothetical protein
MSRRQVHSIPRGSRRSAVRGSTASLYRGASRAFTRSNRRPSEVAATSVALEPFALRILQPCPSNPPSSPSRCVSFQPPATFQNLSPAITQRNRRRQASIWGASSIGTGNWNNGSVAPKTGKSCPQPRNGLYCRSRSGREPLSQAKTGQLSGRRIAIVRGNADIRSTKTRLVVRGRWRWRPAAASRPHLRASR